MTLLLWLVYEYSTCCKCMCDSVFQKLRQNTKIFNRPRWADKKQNCSATAHKILNWGYDLDKGEAYVPYGPRKACYVARCPLGHEARRNITDRFTDPYYYESESLRREQWKYRDVFLTPADPRFKTVYPVQWARLEKERMEREMMTHG